MDSPISLNRRQRKKQETKQKIVKVAMYLFKNNGYEATTMDQLAEEVDISKGTLYNYFPFKESIICEYWQKSVWDLKFHLLQMIQLLPDTKTRLLKTFHKAALELFKSKQDIYRIYLSYWFKNLNNPSLKESLESGFEDVFTMIIKLGQHSGEIRKDISIEYLVKHLEVTFLSACMNWLADPKLFPLETNLDNTASLFVDGAGVGSRKAKSKTPDKSTKGDSAQEKLL